MRVIRPARAQSATVVVGGGLEGAVLRHLPVERRLPALLGRRRLRHPRNHLLVGPLVRRGLERALGLLRLLLLSPPLLTLGLVAVLDEQQRLVHLEALLAPRLGERHRLGVERRPEAALGLLLPAWGEGQGQGQSEGPNPLN